MEVSAIEANPLLEISRPSNSVSGRICGKILS